MAVNLEKRQLIKQGAVAFACLSEFASLAAQDRSLNIGVLPHLSARTMAEQYQPMYSYLSKAHNSVVSISSAADWNHFYKNVKSEQYDIVIAAAHVARVMQLELGLSPIASYHPNIKGVLIATRASGVSSPNQIKNKLIASANPAALVSFEAETWLEAKYHLRMGNDYQCVPVRGADSVAYALLNQQATAGIVCLSDLEVQPEIVKRQIAVVELFAEVPNFIVLSGRPRTSMETRLIGNQLRAFSESSPEGKTFEARTGFKIIRSPDEERMHGMDSYLEKTRSLLVA
jgi:phosphonate transport system substrate-binding protein